MPCRARVVTNKNDEIIRSDKEHTHKRPNFVIQNVHWVRTSGKLLAIVEDFSYYCSMKKLDLFYWRCTKGNSCRAHFTSNKAKRIFKFNFIHNHYPPSFVIRNGVCMKL